MCACIYTLVYIHTYKGARVKVLMFSHEQRCFTLGTNDSGLVIEEGLLSKADTKLKNLVGQASASVSSSPECVLLIC